ncbi:MAG: hypothetical protein ACP5Q5_00465 [Brevinematia bacterium]
MKKFIFLLFIINLSFALEEPKEPSSPVVEENFSTELPSIPDPFKEIKTNSFFLIKAKITLYPYQSVERVLAFSNLQIVVTNLTNFSIYEVQKIEIKKWKANHISNNMYLFMPEKYDFYFYNKKEPFEITGNIELFNILSTKEEKFYSFFYDYWISGKNKYYRWKNSKSVVFDYNFTHPLENVVYKIEFLW